MYQVNKQTRYEIIRELIKLASPELIDSLVRNSSFAGYETGDNPEYRRKELLEYLDDMNDLWKENFTDLTDKQYIRINDDQEEAKQK